MDYITRSSVDACESSHYNRPIAVYMSMEEEHNGITDNDEGPTDHHQFFDYLMCKVDPVLGTVARSYMSTLYAWIYDLDPAL